MLLTTDHELSSLATRIDMIDMLKSALGNQPRQRGRLHARKRWPTNQEVSFLANLIDRLNTPALGNSRRQRKRLHGALRKLWLG